MKYAESFGFMEDEMFASLDEYGNGFLYRYKKIKIGFKGFFGDTCKNI